MESLPFKFESPLSRRFRRIHPLASFTLVEMLAAIAVLALIMVILTQTFTTVSSTWAKTTGRGSAFAGARAGFEALKLNLSQATLNTYLGYATSNGAPVPLVNPSYVGGNASSYRGMTPQQYARASELHFITGPARTLFDYADVKNNTETSGQAIFFQVPAGAVSAPQDRPLGSLVNVLGYYVAFNCSTNYAPDSLSNTLPPRWRYRLMEVIQPSEDNTIYYSTCESTSSVSNGNTNTLPLYNYDLRWVGNMCPSGSFTNTVEHPLAENVILMALLPKLPPEETDSKLTSHPVNVLSTDYTYDSRFWETTVTSPLGTPRSGPYNPLNSPIPLSQQDLQRWRNQLPPLMELILITIDEASAQRLAARYNTGSTPPFEAPAVKSVVDLSQYFQVYDPYGTPGTTPDTDIAKIETGLATLGVNYRVFRTDIALNNSQWSSQ